METKIDQDSILSARLADTLERMAQRTDALDANDMTDQEANRTNTKPLPNSF